MDPPESSAEVRAFYVRHPYPAPVTDLSGYREHWGQRERRRGAMHLMVYASDGRSAKDILQLCADNSEHDTRGFFQRLWRHDQIVFDASRR